MTCADLGRAILHHEAEGLVHMVITVRRNRLPRGHRVRVLPGVRGTLLAYAGGSTTVEVATADMRRYVDRRA